MGPVMEEGAGMDELDQAKRELARLQAVLASTSDAIIGSSRDGIIWEWNRAAEALFGYQASEMLGENIDRIISATGSESALTDRLDLHHRREPCQIDATALTRDLQTVPIWLSVAPVPCSSGERRGFSLVARDLTQRLQAERELKRSLADKDTLLREVHHRVKNNLQVICSMLRLQSSYLSDGPAREMFKSSEERVYAMGLVHEKLYRSKSSSAVDVAGYITELVKQLSRPYVNDAGPTALVETEIVPAVLPLDRAVPFGLLVNELLSNALKHGVSDDGIRSVTVSLSRHDDLLRCTVADRGRGLPGGVLPSQPRTLGLRLVHALSQQLYGRLSYTYMGGAHFCVEFPSLEEGKGTEGSYESDQHSHM